jgi:hypothetical protein
MPLTTLGALLTILQNKLGASDVEADVLLYGSQNDIQQKKTHDRQEQYIQTTSLICNLD